MLFILMLIPTWLINSNRYKTATNNPNAPNNIRISMKPGKST